MRLRTHQGLRCELEASPDLQNTKPGDRLRHVDRRSPLADAPPKDGDDRRVLPSHELEQVRIHRVRMGGAHAVRQVAVGLEGALRQQFG